MQVVKEKRIQLQQSCAAEMIQNTIWVEWGGNNKPCQDMEGTGECQNYRAKDTSIPHPIDL
jgi:hypothetical protein